LHLSSSFRFLGTSHCCDTTEDGVTVFDHGVRRLQA
jgi:hypothetical protein